jgi:hypothetical protein
MNQSSNVVDTGGAPWLANISANFWKNLKNPNAIIKRKVIHEKNQKQKISWHCHFTCLFSYFLLYQDTQLLEGEKPFLAIVSTVFIVVFLSWACLWFFLCRHFVCFNPFHFNPSQQTTYVIRVLVNPAYCKILYLLAVNYDPATKDLIFILGNIYPGPGRGHTANFLILFFYQGHCLPCILTPQYLQRSLFTSGGRGGGLQLFYQSIYIVRVIIYHEALTPNISRDH